VRVRMRGLYVLSNVTSPRQLQMSSRGPLMETTLDDLPLSLYKK
jgi:hypothetical protein